MILPNSRYPFNGLFPGLKSKFGLLDNNVISFLDMLFVCSSCTNCKSDTEYPVETCLCEHNVVSGREAPEENSIQVIQRVEGE